MSLVLSEMVLTFTSCMLDDAGKVIDIEKKEAADGVIMYSPFSVELPGNSQLMATVYYRLNQKDRIYPIGIVTRGAKGGWKTIVNSAGKPAMQEVLNLLDENVKYTIVRKHCQLTRPHSQRHVELLAELCRMDIGVWEWDAMADCELYRINGKTFNPYNNSDLMWALIKAAKLNVNYLGNEVVISKEGITAELRLNDSSPVGQPRLLCEFIIARCIKD